MYMFCFCKVNVKFLKKQEEEAKWIYSHKFLYNKFEYLMDNKIITTNEYRIIKMEIYIIFYLIYMEE